MLGQGGVASPQSGELGLEVSHALLAFGEGGLDGAGGGLGLLQLGRQGVERRLLAGGGRIGASERIRQGRPLRGYLGLGVRPAGRHREAPRFGERGAHLVGKGRQGLHVPQA